MSLRDDFLEALRSVKRDFFKDYDYTDQDDSTPSARDAASSVAADIPPVQRTEPVPEGDMEMSPEQEDRVAESFAGQMDDLHTVGLDDGDEMDSDDDMFPDLDDPTPVGPDLFEMEGMVGEPPSGGGGDGRRIYDFEPDDYYGDEKTVISRNTVIRGALQTEDSVRLLGQIMGDIDCKSNIVVAGKVRGNTTAANAYVIDAQVDGNMMCDDVINVSDDAWILGNIRAQQAEIDGKVKGNIEIRHTVSIGSASSVIGNISTDELEIKRGAFINGQIMMYSPSRDVIDRFDQFDQ